MKKVYCFGVGLHTYVKKLVENPPKGYKFIVVQNEKKSNIISKLKKNKLILYLYKEVYQKAFNSFNLINNIFYEKSPKDADLIFSHGQLVQEEKPWIVEILDTPTSFAGYDLKLFRKNLRKINKILASRWCKKIIIHTSIVRREFENFFSKEILKKIELLPPAIPPSKIIEKRKNSKSIIFLFMGSINNPDDFYSKGGLEVLETFKKLSKRYDNIKLVMRAKVPQNIKERYLLNNIEYLEETLPMARIQQLYRDADIFFFPGHFYFLMATLEAMSFGLPIIALDRHGVSEFIIDGKNGFLVKPSEKIPYPPVETPYLGVRSKKFINHLKVIDPIVVNRLYNRAARLIENKNLREKMGAESLKISNTKFSLEKRNKRLKEIFDAALK